MLYETLDKVNNVFLACCFLHNKLLDYDDRSTWSTGVDFGPGGRDVWFTQEDRPALEVHMRRLRHVSAEEGMAMISPDLDVTLIGRAPLDVECPQTSRDERRGHLRLRELLIGHYKRFCDQRKASK